MWTEPANRNIVFSVMKKMYMWHRGYIWSFKDVKTFADYHKLQKIWKNLFSLNTGILEIYLADKKKIWTSLSLLRCVRLSDRVSTEMEALLYKEMCKIHCGTNYQLWISYSLSTNNGKRAEWEREKSNNKTSFTQLSGLIGSVLRNSVRIYIALLSG